MEFADQLSYWHWWALAAVFVVLEIFSPAVFFLWMGVAAAVLGFVVLVFPALSWEQQMLLFAAFSVASIFVSRRYLDRHPIETDQPLLNRRGQQYVGRTFRLEAPIVDGYGKIRVDDSTWKVSGKDCPQGSHIRVVGVDGVVLKVEQFDREADKHE